VGLLMAVYALHPVLAVTSLLPSDLHGNGGVKASITLNGMSIREVKVQCVTNKVIFEDKMTLAPPHFAVIDEYSVRDVARGESFTPDCNFAWSLWTGPTSGFFLIGAGVTGARFPQLGIPFLLKDGLPFFAPGARAPVAIRSDFSGFSSSQVTAIDGDFVVLYKWPLSPFEEKRAIHMIARRTDGAGDLKWRVAPDSEPTIPDAVSGFIVNAGGDSSGKWAVTMRRFSPPQ
jgi:hypothetical protein